MEQLLIKMKRMTKPQLINLQTSIAVSEGTQKEKDIILAAINSKLNPIRKQSALVETSEIQLGDLK